MHRIPSWEEGELHEQNCQWWSGAWRRGSGSQFGICPSYSPVWAPTVPGFGPSFSCKKGNWTDTRDLTRLAASGSETQISKALPRVQS